MMKSKMRWKRSQAGFTLLEMMGVMSITVILCAFGVNGAVHFAEVNNQRSLDKTAEAIYVAAQNQLTMLYVFDENTDLKNLDTVVTSIPRDYEGSTHQIYYDAWENLRYIDNRTTIHDELAASYLFSDNAIGNLIDDDWVIEFDPQNFTVYSVFYSNNQTLSNGIISTLAYYNDSEIREKLRESVKERMNYGGTVGYYGGAAFEDSEIEGEGGSDTIIIDNSSDPGVTATALTGVNGEKLFAYTTIDYDMRLDSNMPVSSITARLTLTNTDKTVTIPVTDKEEIQLYPFIDLPENIKNVEVKAQSLEFGTRYTVGVILDSLEPDKRFYKLYGQNFEAGEDVTLNAKIFVKNDAGQILSQEELASWTSNSLFADGSDPYNEDEEKREIKVAYGRHLQNLRGYNNTTSTNDKSSHFNAISQVSGITVTQTKEIDWKSYYIDQKTEGYKVNDVPTRRDFDPIINATPNGRAVIKEYNGNGNKIKGLTVGFGDENLEPAGLFQAFDGETLAHIILTGENITAGNSAGGLAALISPINSNTTTIKNCQVYLEPNTDYIQGRDLAINENASLPWIRGTDAVGGLVGQVANGKNLNIENSSASTVLYLENQNETSGGLVGNAAGAIINVFHSYADCYFYSTKNNNQNMIGGLVGSCGNESIFSGSYSAGFLIGQTVNTAAGFTPSSIKRVENSYSLFYFDSVEDKNDKKAENIINVAQLSSGGTASNVAFTYMEQDSISGMSHTDKISDDILKEETAANAANSSPLSNLEHNRTVSKNESIVYKLMGTVKNAMQMTLENMNTDSLYPYPTILNLTHYGDWMTSALLSPIDIHIINQNHLHAQVTVPSSKYLSFAVEGIRSGNAELFVIKSENDALRLINTTSDGSAKDDISKLAVLTINGKIDLTLDDISRKKTHFTELFPSLMPGEDIKIYAADGISATFDILKEAVENPEICNTLFSDNTTDTIAKIANIRHLQNLDPAVSGVSISSLNAEIDVDNLTSAQTDKSTYKITWSAFLDEVGNDGGVSIYSSDSSKQIDNSFYGIYNADLLSFNGNDRTLAGLPIKIMGNEFISESYYKNAGLFRGIDNGMIIQNIKLSDFEVEAKQGHAGIVVAEIAGENAVTLATTLAEGKTAYVDAISEKCNAGGLVGESEANLTITNSAASVYVRSDGAAGGLIGQQNGHMLTIEKSYTGGHTENCIYSMQTPAQTDRFQFVVDTEGKIESLAVDAAGNVTDITGCYNIISYNGAAGGLLGASTGTVKIEKSFSAMSVNAVNKNEAAGGTVGMANDINIKTVYALGQVDGVQVLNKEDEQYSNTKGGYSGAFAGTITGTIEKMDETNPPCYYGDWESVINEFIPFTVKLLYQDPEDNLNLKPFSEDNQTLMAQFTPAKDANLFIPTLTDYSGYKTGSYTNNTLITYWKIRLDGIEYDETEAWQTSGLWSDTAYNNSQDRQNSITISFSDLQIAQKEQEQNINQTGYLLTLVACYTKEPDNSFLTFKVPVDLNAETLKYKTISNVQELNSASLVDNLTNINVPTYMIENYDFLGWYTGENGTGIKIFNEQNQFVGTDSNATDEERTAANHVNIKANDLTLYAHYKKSEIFTVTVDFFYELCPEDNDILSHQNKAQYRLTKGRTCQYQLKGKIGDIFHVTLDLPFVNSSAFNLHNIIKMMNDQNQDGKEDCANWDDWNIAFTGAANNGKYPESTKLTINSVNPVNEVHSYTIRVIYQNRLKNNCMP